MKFLKLTFADSENNEKLLVNPAAISFVRDWKSYRVVAMLSVNENSGDVLEVKETLQQIEKQLAAAE